MRRSFRTLTALAAMMPALGLASAASAQNYADLPPLTPMDEAEVRTLPPEYRTAPAMTVTDERSIGPDGVETITRTRRIDRAPNAAPAYASQAYPSQVYAPAVFEREQWLAECRRRTAGRDRDDTGLIIGGLLGAIAGGVAGYEIAGAGDRLLGSVLGVGGGGLIGGLIGSIFDGDDDGDRYDCEAALDSYLSAYGTPGARIASREIAYGQQYAPMPAYGYGYPTYAYGYAPPPQMVMVPVRSEVQQQVVVRETVREESYSVPGAMRTIPQSPSPKMIKTRP